MAAYCSSQLAYSRIVGCLKAVVQEGKIPSQKLVLHLVISFFYGIILLSCECIKILYILLNYSRLMYPLQCSFRWELFKNWWYNEEK